MASGDHRSNGDTNAAGAVAALSLGLYEAMVDSLPYSLALLDEAGCIIHTNAEWRRFAGDNEAVNAQAYLGWNYLAVCGGAQDEETARIGSLLGELLAGEREDLRYEYPCHSPGEDRWFLLHASRVVVGGAVYAVVSHLDITERRRAELAAEARAEHDDLTGLLTGNPFRERLEQALQIARRRHFEIAVVFVDLDDFKDINDRYGHAVGDAVLRTVGHRLRSDFRGEDAAARLGGDEFVLMVETDPDTDGRSRVLARLREALHRPLTIGDRELAISASIGIAVFPAAGEDAATLLAHADAAMYRAKHHQNETRRLIKADAPADAPSA